MTMEKFVEAMKTIDGIPEDVIVLQGNGGFVLVSQGDFEAGAVGHLASFTGERVVRVPAML